MSDCSPLGVQRIFPSHDTCVTIIHWRNEGMHEGYYIDTIQERIGAY